MWPARRTPPPRHAAPPEPPDADVLPVLLRVVEHDPHDQPRLAAEYTLAAADLRFAWTRSAYRPYPDDPDDGRETDEDGPNKRFTLRGSGWYNHSSNLRASNRHHNPPNFHYVNLGFHLIRHAPEQSILAVSWVLWQREKRVHAAVGSDSATGKQHTPQSRIAICLRGGRPKSAQACSLLRATIWWRGAEATAKRAQGDSA